MELAGLIEAKREAEKTLAEKQDALIMSYKQQEVRHSSYRPCSKLVRQQTPQKVSECSPSAFAPMNPTKQDVTHALGVLEQIKHDMSHLFPEVERLLKERAPSYSSVRRVSSRKSQVEKLPSIPLTNPVNLVAAPVASEKEEVEPMRSISQRLSKISQSTLAAISQMWANAVEETATMESQAKAYEQSPQFTVEEPQLQQSTVDTASQTSMEEPQLQRSTVDTASQTSMEEPQLQRSTVDTASQTNMEEPQLQQSTVDTASQTNMEEPQLQRSTMDTASQTNMEEPQLQQSTVDTASQTNMEEPQLQQSTVDTASQTNMEEPQLQQSTVDTASQTNMEEPQLQRSTMDTASQTMDKPQLQRSTMDTASQTNMEEPQLQNNVEEPIKQVCGSELNEFSPSSSTCVSSSESHSSLCRRPSSIDCQSSEDLRIDEGRVPDEMLQEESYQSICRPPSIECMSSEALRVDEGKITKPAFEDKPQQSSLKVKNVSNEVAHQYDSASTLGVLSTRWSTLQQVDSQSTAEESKCTSSEETYEPSTQDSASSFSALGRLSERWSELDSSNKGCQRENTSSQSSVHKIPTPPTYPRPAGYPVRGVLSCQSSIHVIKDCSLKECVSPLTVHSQAMVPYQSQTTRLGLRTNETLASSEQIHMPTKEERQRESRADAAEKEEGIRSEMDLPPSNTAPEELHTAEVEGNQVPAPSTVVSSNLSETQLKMEEEKVSCFSFG